MQFHQYSSSYNSLCMSDVVCCLFLGHQLSECISMRPRVIISALAMNALLYFILFYFFQRILVYLSQCFVTCQTRVWLAGIPDETTSRQRFSAQAMCWKYFTFMSSVRCHCGNTNAYATVVHMNFKGPILCPIFGSFHLQTLVMYDGTHHLSDLQPTCKNSRL